MAIFVEWARTHFADMATPNWQDRITYSQEYGFPMEDTLSTYPPEMPRHNISEWFNKRRRSGHDGYVIYTTHGLLDTIYRYFELPNDPTSGIRGLRDIATTTVKLTTKRYEDDLIHTSNILRDKHISGTYILHDGGTPSKVTEKMRQLARGSKDEGLILPHIIGLLSIFPIDANSSANALIELHFKACNALGNDMDELTYMAIQSRRHQ